MNVKYKYMSFSVTDLPPFTPLEIFLNGVEGKVEYSMGEPFIKNDENERIQIGFPGTDHHFQMTAVTPSCISLATPVKAPSKQNFGISVSLVAESATTSFTLYIKGVSSSTTVSVDGTSTVLSNTPSTFQWSPSS